MSVTEIECRRAIALAYAEWFLYHHPGIVTEDFIAYEQAIGLDLPF